MTGRDPSQPAHGQRRDDERRETDHDGSRDREIGVPAAEGVAHRPDADRQVAPVLDRVEGRSKAMKKPRSKSLIRTSTPSRSPATHDTMRRAREPAGRRPARRRASPSSGSRTKEPGVSSHGRIGNTRAAHTTASGEQREQRGRGRVPGAGRRETGGRLVPVPPQPPDVAAERLDEHREGDGQQDAAHRERRNLRSRDHQRDPLRRRHRLAPVAPRQRRPQPRQRPSRREERVARKADQRAPSRRPSGRPRC